MPTFSKYDITKDGANFYPEILADATFRRNGVIYGHNGPWYWGVVDVDRFPLYVWQKTKASNYENTAEALHPPLFSNGPMMKRFTPGQLALLSVVAALITALIGGFLGYRFGGGWGAYVGVTSGAFIGFFTTLHVLLFDWVPLGPVHGDRWLIDDPGVPKPDPWLAHLGRSGTAFSTYRVALGANIQGLKEAIAGLVPLVLAGTAMSSIPGTANYNQAFADLTKPSQTAITAWALSSVSTNVGEKGLITAIGTRETGINATLVTILLSVKVRDAVGMDGSTSVMLGAETDLLFPTLWGFYFKQWIQRYGFNCDY